MLLIVAEQTVRYLACLSFTWGVDTGLTRLGGIWACQGSWGFDGFFRGMLWVARLLSAIKVAGGVLRNGSPYTARGCNMSAFPWLCRPFLMCQQTHLAACVMCYMQGSSWNRWDSARAIFQSHWSTLVFVSFVFGFCKHVSLSFCFPEQEPSFPCLLRLMCPKFKA